MSYLSLVFQRKEQGNTELSLYNTGLLPMFDAGENSQFTEQEYNKGMEKLAQYLGIAPLASEKWAELSQEDLESLGAAGMMGMLVYRHHDFADAVELQQFLKQFFADIEEAYPAAEAAFKKAVAERQAQERDEMIQRINSTIASYATKVDAVDEQPVVVEAELVTE